MQASKSTTRATSRRDVLAGAAATAGASGIGIPAAAKPHKVADAIYFGGDILTMRGRTPEYVEALAVRDGKIVHAGRKAAADALKGDRTVLVDLQGRMLLPGFIDTHGHMIYFGKNLVDGDLFGAKDVPELVARMKAHTAKTLDGWLVGFGYSVPALAEKRHPTAAELDEISSDRPVLVVDSSGHQAAMNSALIKLAKLSAATPDPSGGRFLRKSGSQELLGGMEETALLNIIRPLRPPFTGAMADRVATDAAALWAAYGQTTAMECGLGLGADDIDLVKNAIDKKLLPIDLVLFAKESVTNAAIDAAYVARAYRSDEVGTARKMLAARPDLDRRYVNRVRLGGVKFWLDGSIPTGWMSQPYASPPPGAPADYRAYGQIDDKTLAEAFDRFWTSPMQVNMHMMGDAAAEQALRAIEAAIRKHGRSDHRPVFVHATYMRLDQIERMRAVGGVPSYLSMALVGGGDTALKLWGADRANHAMAASTAFKKGVRFTLSHDAPVTPQPTILALVDAAVNRTTVNGTVVGAQERLTPYQGLLAVTNHAAWQIKEERAKGSLEPGKLADLVILDRNPLKVDPKAIKTIRVVETIKEGRTVFDARRSAQRLGALGERLMALSGHATHQFSFGPCPGCRGVASGGARAAAATSRFECT